MSGRTVLITGGTGFIGSHLARCLVESGDRVVLLDLNQPADEMAWLLRPIVGEIQIVQGSVDDASLIAETCRQYAVTEVVHTAASVSFEALQHRPRAAADVNVGGTINVLEAVRRLGLKRMIYFSTIGVLPKVQYEPMDEKHPIILGDDGPGAGFYGASKAAGEAFCYAFRSSFGVDFAIVRPSAVYGVGARVPNFIKPMVENAVRGQPTSFPNGRDFARDYTHVRDVVDLVQRLLATPPEALEANRLFYAATGQPLVTAGQVAEIVREQIPGAQIEIGAGLSDEDRRKILFRGRLDVGPAHRQLGYEPHFADLRAGVAEYIAAYRAYLADARYDVVGNRELRAGEVRA